ncbi:hypothetical protein AB1Y20_005153 [Prymnesium parvum]|uniref:Peroxisomal membrane protein 2 n=1 Tax=Prymnesium parvum TaxID=97485 RepID=A0AB34J3B8_PRYPA
MLWEAYTRQLARRPVCVKACTSCTTFTLTDLVAQARECWDDSGHASFDPARTAQKGSFGLLWLGPLNHVFWGRTVFGLEYWFPGRSWSAVFTRVAVDQATNMPLNMVMFLAWPSLLARDIEGAISNVRKAFWPSFTFALSIWPFVHPISFRYVPLEHRLLVLNICSFFVFSYATLVSDGSAQNLREPTRTVECLE